MGNPTCLRRVPQSGLCVRGEIIPLAFFRHGQPGRRFVVCPAEQGWRIHVRTTDIDAILTAYREWRHQRPSRPIRSRRSGGADGVIPSRPLAGDRAPQNPAPSGRSVGLVAARDVARLLKAERRELEKANALALELVAMKARLMSAGRPAFADPWVQRLQERHARHLDRCIRLRSLLCDLVGGQSRGMQSA